jgi:predicted metal-binding protein
MNSLNSGIIELAGDLVWGLILQGGSMGNQIKKIDTSLDESKLAKDLERYKEKAIELGAANARIVKTKDIPVDDRVPLKCQIPRCFGYGTSAHCPPNTMKPDELRNHLKHYRRAIFFTRNLPTALLLKDAADKDRIAAFQSIYKIVKSIESMAFYDGHYLAFGLGAGGCRRTFCGEHETCSALEGKSCRFSLLARPSMEAVGIDVYKMTAAADWEIYPIGSHADAEETPKAVLAGLIVVE